MKTHIKTDDHGKVHPHLGDELLRLHQRIRVLEEGIVCAADEWSGRVNIVNGHSVIRLEKGDHITFDDTGDPDFFTITDIFYSRHLESAAIILTK